jgi:hypothetical protein
MAVRICNSDLLTHNPSRRDEMFIDGWHEDTVPAP